MSGYLIDTNVLLDIATADPVWLGWSEQRILDAAGAGEALFINPIIYAELAPAFETRDRLEDWLDEGLFQRLSLPYEAGWLAAEAYRKYRREGGVRSSPLPDFYIGAHALVEDRALVTRDRGRYRTYFPNVRLIAPPE
jgi:hypothetical protein